MGSRITRAGPFKPAKRGSPLFLQRELGGSDGVCLKTKEDASNHTTETLFPERRGNEGQETRDVELVDPIGPHRLTPRSEIIAFCVGGPRRLPSLCIGMGQGDVCEVIRGVYDLGQRRESVLDEVRRVVPRDGRRDSCLKVPFSEQQATDSLVGTQRQGPRREWIHDHRAVVLISEHTVD